MAGSSGSPGSNGASSSVASSAVAQTPAGQAIDAMMALRGYRNLTLSRDGSHIAYSVALSPISEPARRTAFVVDLRAPHATPRRISASSDTALDERFPVFSPDGKHIALLSTIHGKKSVLLYPVDVEPGTNPREICTLPASLAMPRFSPDGRTLFALYTEADPAAADDNAPQPSSAAANPQRILSIDVESGARHVVSPIDLHIHEFDVSPDGRSFAAVASPAANPPDYFSAKLYWLPPTGTPPRVLVAPTRQLGDPRISPDGRTVAFVSGLISDEGNTGGDLWTVPTAGGVSTNLTPGRPSTITSSRWRPDSRSLVVNELVDGRAALSEISASTSNVAVPATSTSTLSRGASGEVLFRADATLRAFNLSADGDHVAMVHDSFSEAQSIWAGPIRAPQVIESTVQRYSPAWGEVKRLSSVSDGYETQSFLIAPTTVVPGKKYPLITLVHGGPASSWVPMGYELWALAAAGYFLLLPNPRGSFGKGAAFQEANVRDLGGGDLRDLRASVHAAIESAPIDADRVGLMGWSYGGFMAMWAATQTQEFRAVVAGAGISNWQSYVGQTLVPGWTAPYFAGTAYDEPARYAAASPIHFVKQIHSPLLLLVGDRDTDCPAPQSRELWQALKTQGTPTELVIYPNETHGFVQPGHRRDRIERMVAWFDRYTSSREATPAH